ncbi:MAG: glycosyltransferase, partial [Candidatus Bathyarchaeia archaeon]
MHVVGGGTRWTNEVIHHLRVRGHDVQLFSDDGKAPMLLPRSYQGLWMANKMAAKVKKVKDLDCLLLCSDMEFSPLFRGVAPLIGVLHEVAFLKRLHVHGWRRLLQAPARGMGYMDFAALDAVVVNSNFTANNVKEVFPETYVVYPGVDHDRFSPEGSTDEGFLIYVARFSPGDKNHTLAIEVASRLHTRLLLVGSLG